MPEERLSKAIDDLRAEIRGVADLIRGERAERQAEARTDRRRIAAVIAAIVVVGAITILWNRHDIVRSQRQWCVTLTVLSAGPAPTTDRGRQIAAELRRLSGSFGCPH